MTARCTSNNDCYWTFELLVLQQPKSKYDKNTKSNHVRDQILQNTKQTKSGLVRITFLLQIPRRCKEDTNPQCLNSVSDIASRTLRRADWYLPASRTTVEPSHSEPAFREVGLTLKLKVLWSFQTSANIYQWTRRSIIVDLNVYVIKLFHFIRKVLTSEPVFEWCRITYLTQRFTSGMHSLHIFVIKESTIFFFYPFNRIL